jgi:hypothetical protein
VFVLGLVALALVLGIVLGAWLAYLRGRRRGGQPPEQPTEEPLHEGRAIPSSLDAAKLQELLAHRLAGTPADGSAPAEGAPPARVVWVDGGDEVLVHLDSVQTRLVDGVLLVSIDLESAETGRAPLVVPLALGGAGDPAGLVATTDELPRGDAALVARWGEPVQAAVWSSLLAVATEHAAERGGAARAIAVDGKTLRLHAAEPLSPIARAP